MQHNKKVIVVLPAYNAEGTLGKTLADLPMAWLDDIILVDDASRDGTVKLAKNLGLKIFVHEKNLGYGGNQKTCYYEALQLNADIVVMVHPDHQYDPAFIPELIKPLLDDECDAVFGSRMMIRKNALQGGMPYWKYLANIFLTRFENFVLGLDLTEYHSGFRAYSRKALETLPWGLNSNDFVFDTEIIIQLAVNNFKIKEIPISTRYFPGASMIGLSKSLKYGFDILRNMLKYVLSQGKIIKDRQFSKVVKKGESKEE